MQGIARFVMRNRFTGAAFLLTCSFLPLFVWFGNAALALWTLRRGAVEGATVAGLALVGYVLFGWLAGGQFGAGSLAFVLVLWAPVFVVALVLRTTVSLQLAVALSTALAVAAYGVLTVAVPNDAWIWVNLIGLDMSPLSDVQQQRLAGVGYYLPLVLGLSVWLNTVVGLLLGRYWQAALYNPGGFAEEFLGFRTGLAIAVMAGASWLGAVVTGIGELRQLSILLGAGLILQGFAIVHVMARARNWGWFVPALMYVTLPFLWPLVMVLGAVDSVRDFRRRLLPNGDSDD